MALGQHKLNAEMIFNSKYQKKILCIDATSRRETLDVFNGQQVHHILQHGRLRGTILDDLCNKCCRTFVESNTENLSFKRTMNDLLNNNFFIVEVRDQA